jgi:S-adenosylmethionine:tRNA ribosyltransferase-isomerase
MIPSLSFPRKVVLTDTRSCSRESIFKLESYFYQLPSDLIAQQPISRRDRARLLVIDRHQRTIRHDTFNHLNTYLPLNSHLVINNSKVVPARLLGHRATGGAVEVFLLNQLEDGYSYEVLLRPLKKIHEGEEINFGPGFSATLENKEKRVMRFYKKNITRHLQKEGHIPLPPYINRPDTPRDREDYQTVYAKQPGSVACPTAGLHFTKGLIKNLKDQGHRFLELTLHINYGTFKPVQCADIRAHVMHTEQYSLSPGCRRLVSKGPIASTSKSCVIARNEATKVLIPDTRRSSQSFYPVVAVGTTSCRVLEAVAQTKLFTGSTDIFIYPGHQFQAVDALITNFHLPYSTLLMLVCAFGGYDLVMRAYQEAINKRYRFYSYGDAMLII